MTFELIVENFLRDNEEVVKGPSTTNEELGEILNRFGKDETNITLSSLPEDYKNFMEKYGYIGAHPMQISGRSDSVRQVKYYHVYQRTFWWQCTGSRKMKAERAMYFWKIAEWGSFRTGGQIDYYFDLSRVGKGYVRSVEGTKKDMLYARSFTEFLEKIFEEYKMGPKKEKIAEEHKMRPKEEKISEEFEMRPKEEKICEEYKVGPKEEKSLLDAFFESYRG